MESISREEEEAAEDSGDDNSVEEPEPISPIQANEAVKALRNFIMTFDKSGAKERDFLRSLYSVEDSFLRMQAKIKRQSTLEDFFD